MFARALLIVVASGSLLACATPKHTLFLARHGQTQWNRVSRFQGDPDLDQIGYINRVSLWALMRGEKLAHIYTSKLRRTQRTAELVAKEKALPLRKRAALNEIHSGILTGVCRTHMEPGYAKHHARRCVVPQKGVRIGPALKIIQRAWARARTGGLAGKIPLGENYHDMAKRARPFIPELMSALEDGQVLAVGHGLINRVFLTLLTGWPLSHVKRLRQENDQVYRFEGLGTKRVVVSLYTPGFGWKRCTPPVQGQKRLDCSPGPPKALHVMAKGLGEDHEDKENHSGKGPPPPTSPKPTPAAKTDGAKHGAHGH